jgi:hypothetical protein
MLHDAIQAGWINQNSTRAVFVEWVLYNPNANLFAFAQGVVEFSSTSSLIPNYKIRVVNLYRWGRNTSYVGVVLELVVFAYISFFFITETRQVLRIGITEYAPFTPIPNSFSVSFDWHHQVHVGWLRAHYHFEHRFVHSHHCS